MWQLAHVGAVAPSVAPPEFGWIHPCGSHMSMRPMGRWDQGRVACQHSRGPRSWNPTRFHCAMAQWHADVYRPQGSGDGRSCSFASPTIAAWRRRSSTRIPPGTPLRAMWSWSRMSAVASTPRGRRPDRDRSGRRSRYGCLGCLAAMVERSGLHVWLLVSWHAPALGCRGAAARAAGDRAGIGPIANAWRAGSTTAAPSRSPSRWVGPSNSDVTWLTDSVRTWKPNSSPRLCPDRPLRLPTASRSAACSRLRHCTVLLRLDGPRGRRWFGAARQVESRYADLDVPALHIGGWYDSFIDGTLRNFSGCGRMLPANRLSWASACWSDPGTTSRR